MNERVKSKYNKESTKNMPLYFNLIFYINAINQELYNDNCFDSNYIIKVGRKTISKNVLLNYEMDNFLFDIEHYLLSVFYYDVNENDKLLYTYLKFFEPKYKDKYFKGKLIALCLLFAEKFKSFTYFKNISILSEVVNQEELNNEVNIIQIFEYFSNKHKNKFFLKENNNIFDQDKDNEGTFIKPSLMTSIIFHKIALPYVLLFINEKYKIDKIKIYDFNNNIVDYNSLDEINYVGEGEVEFIDENLNDHSYNNYIKKEFNQQKLEFIDNYFKLLNYALDEIVLASNKNYCVYNFSDEIEFEEILESKKLRIEYDIKEYERIKNKDEKDILRREILDLHFNNFQNCYSRKNEWLLVKYMERKINEFILSLNKKYDDSEEYDTDFFLDNEIEKKMNNFSDKDIKS